MRNIAFLLLLCSIALFAGCSPAAPTIVSNQPVSINRIPMTNAPIPPSKPIEEMYWATFAGPTQKMAELKGKAVILDFWATYCAPCIEAIPHLIALQKKHGKENLEIIGLHVGGDEDRPKVPAFAEKLKIDYPMATPEDELIRFIFGSESSIPQTAVFDRNGKLVKKLTGFNDQIKRELDAAVEEAVRQ